MKPPPNLHQDYDRMSSLPKRSEGVAIYTRKGYTFRAIYDTEWSPNLMMVATGSLAIVTVYVS